MANVEKHLYEFGPFHIDTAERLLYRGEELIPLTPKAIDTLLVLIANRGRVVEKDELIKAVWPDTFVEEGALARNVSALRKAFGSDTDDSQFIATVPKRGYRFVAPVTVPEPPEPPRKPRKWLKRLAWLISAVLLIVLIVLVYPRVVSLLSRLDPPGARHMASLAVLPLDNLSRNAAQEPFTDGMHEELINTLARIEALRVKSRISVLAYKGVRKPLPQIARELDVDAIVTGSVLQSENRVRITVELFEGKTERQLFAQSYQRDLREVLALQAEVAESPVPPAEQRHPR